MVSAKSAVSATVLSIGGSEGPEQTFAWAHGIESGRRTGPGFANGRGRGQKRKSWCNHVQYLDALPGRRASFDVLCV